MHRLALIIILLNILTSVPGKPILETKPDPNLAPIITELLNLKRYDEACKLYAKLDVLGNDLAPGTEPMLQIVATKESIQAGLQERTGSICPVKNTPPPVQAEMKATSSPLAINDYDEDDEILVADAVMARNDGSASVGLCADCNMDYNDPESKSFMEEFENSRKSGDDSMANAKSKITRIFVLSILGAVGLLAAVTLMLFFGVRACIRRASAAKTKKKGSGTTASPSKSPMAATPKGQQKVQKGKKTQETFHVTKPRVAAV